ncbi:LysR family transcriptional regulator [Vibrio rhizosphaerae]|uniref:LysR family transcriptional regulator n=1 Tax=Vibrio rhizosphaerae TaxID=398736 RepID=UPI00056F1A1E|nr:LysR family transcriptional regulator [Vibrio rhizosphaerae]
MVNVNTLDLNLLRTLDVLLAEHNVTRAAERLNLSQPSVSVHLNKLRTLFHDQLLIPSSRGMRPTAFAEEIRLPLREALSAIETALHHSLTFHPEQFDKTWKLAAADYAEQVAIQPMMNRILGMSSHCRLSISHMIPERLPQQLERGEIDLAFHLREDSLSTLKSRTVLKETYVLTGRRNHPMLQDTIDLPCFCQLSHAIVSPNGGGFVGVTDEILRQQGQHRNVVLSVPNFQSLITALKQSDLVALVPARLAVNDPELTTIAAPIDLPAFELVMLWHARSHHDPAHQWLRNQFLSSHIPSD